MIRPQFKSRSHQARMLVFNLSRIWEVRLTFLLSVPPDQQVVWRGHRRSDNLTSPEMYPSGLLTEVPLSGRP